MDPVNIRDKSVPGENTGKDECYEIPVDSNIVPRFKMVQEGRKEEKTTKKIKDSN